MVDLRLTRFAREENRLVLLHTRTRCLHQPQRKRRLTKRRRLFCLLRNERVRGCGLRDGQDESTDAKRRRVNVNDRFFGDDPVGD